MRKPELKAASNVVRAAPVMGASANDWPVPGMVVPAYSLAARSLVSIQATPVTRLV